VERLTLTELKDRAIKVGNLDAAYQNIHDFATELVEELQPTTPRRSTVNGKFGLPPDDQGTPQPDLKPL